MTDRQQYILEFVVKSYTKTAVPVGSKQLCEVLDCSSATIRNDMAALEKEGYLVQPHTSAGRIPTDKGYRYFVNSLMGDQELTKNEQQKLQSDLLQMQAQYKRMARVLAKLLSGYAEGMAVSSIADEKDYATSGIQKLVQHPEFGDAEELSKIFEVVDRFDETVDVYLEALPDGKQVATYIGSENPVQEMKNCSVVVSEFELPDGKRGVIALLGPKRMKYGKNMSLVSYVTKLLQGGSFVIIGLMLIG